MTTGFPHLTKLLNATTFPWLLSNIIDTNTGHQPEPLKRFWVTERCGVRIGVIGLVEKYALSITRCYSLIGLEGLDRDHTFLA